MFSTWVAITCPLFTFHDVSINTKLQDPLPEPLKIFTFHDVSINTESEKDMIEDIPTLHSTMFLLIPFTEFPFDVLPFFTFHDVSINTKTGIWQS